jgi:hypothetical protein
MSPDANADAMPMAGSPVTDPSATVAADAVPAPDAGTSAGDASIAAEGIVADGMAVTVATPAPDAPAKPVRRFRARALVVGRRLLRLVLTLSLFGAGVYLGWRSFVDNRPVTEVVGDPAVIGNPTPAIVAELAAAIAADDADAIRAALAPEIFSNYTADLQNFGIATVEGVDTLGTYVDDNRTATVLVIHGRDADRNAFNVNLVVITQDGQIVRLR